MTTTQLPTLNSELLYKIIKWAEQDEEWLDHFAGWGKWDQGHWGFFGAPEGERIQYQLDDDEVIDLTPEERKEILNGVCETAYCVAGQAVTQAGYRILLTSGLTSATVDGEEFDGWDGAYCVPTEWTGEYDEKGHKVYRDTGSEEQVSIVGRRVLGLTPDESGRLFDGDNSIELLKEIVNGICVNRQLPLLFPDEEVYDFGLDDDDDEF